MPSIEQKKEVARLWLEDFWDGNIRACHQLRKAIAII